MTCLRGGVHGCRYNRLVGQNATSLCRRFSRLYGLQPLLLTELSAMDTARTACLTTLNTLAERCNGVSQSFVDQVVPCLLCVLCLLSSHACYAIHACPALCSCHASHAPAAVLSLLCLSGLPSTTCLLCTLSAVHAVCGACSTCHIFWSQSGS